MSKKYKKEQEELNEDEITQDLEDTLDYSEPEIYESKKQTKKKLEKKNKAQTLQDFLF